MTLYVVTSPKEKKKNLDYIVKSGKHVDCNVKSSILTLSP